MLPIAMLCGLLCADPTTMPVYGKEQPPPPRMMQEVEAVLAGAPKPPVATRALKIVLVAGKKDHGPGEHDYPAWLEAWSKLFQLAEKATVDKANEWPSSEQLRTADVFVFYQKGSWTPQRAKDIDAYFARGGGAVYIHWAVNGDKEAPAFAKRIGLASVANATKYRHGPLDLGFSTGKGHPIARNFDKLHLHDESYWEMRGDPKRLNLLGTGKEEGADQPLFWTIEPGQGRVFVSIPGHYAWTFDDPLFRVLLLRGIAWSAKEPVDRFNNLTTQGARIK